MAVSRKSDAKPTAATAKYPEPVAAPAQSAPRMDEITTPNPVVLIQESADQALAQAREAQEHFRKAAEMGMEKTREAYARLKDEAEAATGCIETSFSAARQGLQSLNSKAFDAIKTQSQVGFDHARALLTAKGPQDIFALHSEFARKQFETFAAQAKELTGHVQEIAAQTLEPLKIAASRRFQA